MPNSNSTQPSSKLASVRRHPVATAIVAILAFLAWTFPIGIAQAWPAFVRNKTIPEWLSERRWPGMTTSAYFGLTISFYLTLTGLLLALVITSRRRGDPEKDKTIQGQYDRIKELEDKIRSLKAKQAEDAKTLENAKKEAARCSELAREHSIGEQFREKEVETLKSKYGRLFELADKQAQAIDEYVKLEKVSLGDVNLEQGLRTIRFGLQITNYSVFNISIDDDFDGPVEFRGQELLEKKRLLNPIKDLPPLGYGRFVFEQRLSPTEAAFIADSENAAEPNFLFHKLRLTIRGGDGSPQVEPKRLYISDSHGVSIKGGPPIYGGGGGATGDQGEQDKRKALRDELKAILDEGYRVALSPNDTVYESDVKHYNQWQRRAEGFVRINRDEADVKRFQKGGLPVLEGFLKDYLD